MSHPVNWFHFNAKDYKSLSAFYGKAFAWKLSPGMNMDFVAAEPGGINGGIAASPDGKTGVLIYIGTGNLEKQLAAVTDAGGSAAGPIMDLPPGMGRISHFIDPEGNMVGLWEAAAPPPAAAKKAAKRAPAKKAAPKKAAPKKAAPKKAAPKKAAPKKAAPKKA